ncbi:predicted protein [Nematostella vectensis]|uniref:COMM domain-containing protein n=2 Tax=Nematostella vectensis TaxID=45351 RepID=A7SUC8_NEMVE|nr:predicted protein [Nematostella vectensis]|eukprot:XP_001624781.1 predicted protein [Nematostella vectensis]
MALLFQSTAKLRTAVQLINNIDTSRFPLLLTRIVQKLHLRDENAFTAEEEEKLQVAFALDKDDLHIVLETCAFVFEQAAYHNAKPQGLQQQLQNLNLEDDKVNSIVEVWVASGKSLIDKLRKRSLAPVQLDCVNWRLNLQMAQANMSKMKLPNAVFELGISTSGKEQENIHIEFTHDELFAFYNQLESIQSQLDSLR